MYIRNLARTSLFTLSHCDRITNAIDKFKTIREYNNPLFQKLGITESNYITSINHHDKYGVIKYNNRNHVYILYIRNRQDLVNAILLNSKNNKLIACYDDELFDIKSELDNLCTIYDIDKENVKNKLRLIPVSDLEKIIQDPNDNARIKMNVILLLIT